MIISFCLLLLLKTSNEPTYTFNIKIQVRGQAQKLRIISFTNCINFYSKKYPNIFQLNLSSPPSCSPPPYPISPKCLTSTPSTRTTTDYYYLTTYTTISDYYYLTTYTKWIEGSNWDFYSWVYPAWWRTSRTLAAWLS